MKINHSNIKNGLLFNTDICSNPIPHKRVVHANQILNVNHNIISEILKNQHRYETKSETMFNCTFPLILILITYTCT